MGMSCGTAVQVLYQHGGRYHSLSWARLHAFSAAELDAQLQAAAGEEEEGKDALGGGVTLLEIAGDMDVIVPLGHHPEAPVSEAAKFFGGSTSRAGRWAAGVHARLYLVIS